MKTIRVSDFTTLPGPRYTTDGPHSGQEFRESYLKQAFREARAEGVKLLVDLDGAEFGYPASFLEESFGGLAREFGIAPVQEGLEFSSTDEPMLEGEIRAYIRNAMDSGPPKDRSVP